MFTLMLSECDALPIDEASLQPFFDVPIFVRGELQDGLEHLQGHAGDITRPEICFHEQVLNVFHVGLVLRQLLAVLVLLQFQLLPVLDQPMLAVSLLLSDFFLQCADLFVTRTQLLLSRLDLLLVRDLALYKVQPAFPLLLKVGADAAHEPNHQLLELVHRLLEEDGLAELRSSFLQLLQAEHLLDGFVRLLVAFERGLADDVAQLLRV